MKIVIINLLLFLSLQIFAGEPKKDEKTLQKITPEVPAKKEILEKLKSLGDNTAMILGNTTILAEEITIAKGWHKMNKTGPRGRDYSSKMPYMPDRKRAFFCGANHGAAHRFNDAWEFDLPSNSWILLYMPDFNDYGPDKDYSQLELKDGWLRTKKGGPAHPAHTWWGLTYDQHAKKVLWMNSWPKYSLPEKLAVIGKSEKDLYKGPPIWSYNFDGKQWEPVPTQKPWPRSKDAGSLQYIPPLKKTLWTHMVAGDWLLDAKDSKWENVTGGKVSVWPEMLTCFDESRNLMIAYRGPGKEQEFITYHMKIDPDAKKFAWEIIEKKIGTAREDQKGAPRTLYNYPYGHDARSLLYYDPKNKVALLFEKHDQAMWVYDPDKKEWKDTKFKGGQPKFEKADKPVGFFDEDQNVFVMIGSEYSWVYRYKN